MTRQKLGQFKRLGFYLLILPLSALICGRQLLACVKMGDVDLSIVGSYQSGKQVYSSKKSELVLGNCRKANGMYIVFATAPVYTDLNMRGVSNPDGELQPDSCKIDQSPFLVSSPNDVGMGDFYDREARFLNRCLEVEVTDANTPLNVAEQINCEVNQTSPNRALLRGPKCVLKISESSEFTVKFRMSESCLKRSTLIEGDEAQPMDVKASVGIYRATDLSPGNPDYTILGFVNSRVVLQPSDDVIPVSKYFGRDTGYWPDQYGAEVSIGRVTALQRIRNVTPSFFMRVPFLVNNNCPEVCKNGICTSPCHFSAPIVAKMTLAKKGANESSFRSIDWWYQGSAVPSKFLGELALGREIMGQRLAIGDRFLITAEFSDPALLYRVILDQAKNTLIKINQDVLPLGSAGAGELQSLNSILSTLIPNESLPDMGEINDLRSDTELVIKQLEALVGSDDTWPPYYSKVISNGKDTDAKQVFQTLQVGFRIAGVTPSGAASLDHIMVKRKSKLYGDYEKYIKIQPSVKCQ